MDFELIFQPVKAYKVYRRTIGNNPVYISSPESMLGIFALLY